ncbi:GNAT family N-acetyltransferase [Streptomyces sp. NPDC058373]|uniref:GNAT family N-acetyltransferase n=1 Tax=Streptomyces sp. NPDC058373 TaxID=3346465 RepID=UPI003650174E
MDTPPRVAAPATPSPDELRAYYDLRMRRQARPDGPGAVVERVGGSLRQTGGPDGWDGVVWSGLDVGEADAVIAAHVAHFAALGRSFEWKLYGHDRLRPAAGRSGEDADGLAARLRAAGFVAEPAESLMVAEADRLPHRVPLPAGMRLHRLTGPDEADLVAEVHQAAFGDDRTRIRAWVCALLADRPAGSAVLVVLDGDRPLSAGRLEWDEGGEFAGLWGGGTVPAARGLGLYRALVAERARIAVERGVRWVQVDATDRSRPILDRLGFRTLTTTTPYVWTPPASTASRPG